MWNKVKIQMDKKEINQEQLAKLMSVHSSVISSLKLGRINKPSFELMCKIADALGVSLDVFRDTEDDHE